MRPTPSKGIRHFEAKQKLLAAVLPASNFAAFLVKTLVVYNKTLGLKDNDLRLDQDKLRQAAEKWKQGPTRAPSNPEGKYLAYWDWVLSQHIGLPQVTANEFFVESFVDFATRLLDEFPHAVSAQVLKSIGDDSKSMLPDDERGRLMRLCQGLDPAKPPFEFGRVHTPLYEEAEGMRSAIRAGRVYPWHCFLTPEAARQWNALVENGNYAMYSACLATLGELLESGQWTEAVACGGYNVGVALAGGGSPEKDVLLASALATRVERVQYVLIDLSHRMMTHSEGVMRRLLKQPVYEDLAHKIQLQPGLCFNILELPRFPIRHHVWDRVVWAILGGTIGNLPERRFFESIATPSQPGDLLIIGLDTHDGEKWDTFQDRIRTQYQGEEVCDLLLEGRQGPSREVQISFRKAGEDDVPGSWMADFRAQCDGHKVVVTSTRYSLDAFLKYANKWGWEHVHTVHARESTFRQVLLRRT